MRLREEKEGSEGIKGGKGGGRKGGAGEKGRKEEVGLTWNIVGYLKPSTERTYLLTNNPSTRMTMKIEAAPIFILTTHNMQQLPTNLYLVVTTSQECQSSRHARRVTGAVCTAVEGLPE